jgi:hypothetical protein
MQLKDREPVIGTTPMIYIGHRFSRPSLFESSSSHRAPPRDRKNDPVSFGYTD